MSPTKRVLAVMHQVPWTFRIIDNKVLFEMKRSHQSQIAGAEALKSCYEVIWIGWVDEPHDQNVKDAFWREKKVALVETDEVSARGHYSGYCKGGILST
jgi:trehalose-6-phosphate synthase